MTTTNLTGSRVNGVYEISTANNVSSNGGADTEAILLRDNGAIRASGSATLTFTACTFFLNNVSGTAGHPNQTALSYNADSTNRGDNGRYIKFRRCEIIYKTTARRNIFVSELTDSKVINQDGANQLFCYTQPNAHLENTLFLGIRTMELPGPPSIMSGITFDGVEKNYLNWEAGRLDMYGLAILNKPSGAGQSDGWIGQGNGSNNYVWQWNPDTSVNHERVYITDALNRYYVGVTISWEFIDRDTSNPIQDVKVKVKDDFPGTAAGGSMTERGEYLTNASGHVNGTWDGKNRTTVTQQDINTIYMVRKTVTRIGANNTRAFPASNITGDQGTKKGNYDLDEVLNQIEIKHYEYEARAGHLYGDTFDSSVQIGELNADGTVKRYSTKILAVDNGISETNRTTVAGYTALENLDKAYDRIKLEWYDNDGYPLPTFSNKSLTLGSTDLTIDGSTTVPVYAFSGNEITLGINTASKKILAGTKVKEITTTGNVTLANGATVEGGTINADVTISSGVDLKDLTIDGDLHINTGADSTLTFDNVTVTGQVFNDDTAHTLTIQAANGSSLTAGDSGTGAGQTDIQNSVIVTITVVDNDTGNPIQGAHVYLYKTSDKSQLLSDTTDANGQVTMTHNYSADVDFAGWVREMDLTSPDYNQADVNGTITGNGFTTTVKMNRYN